MSSNFHVILIYINVECCIESLTVIYLLLQDILDKNVSVRLTCAEVILVGTMASVHLTKPHSRANVLLDLTVCPSDWEVKRIKFEKGGPLTLIVNKHQCNCNGVYLCVTAAMLPSLPFHI